MLIHPGVCSYSWLIICCREKKKKEKSSLNCCCRELDGWELRKHRRHEKPSRVRRSCQGFSVRCPFFSVVVVVVVVVFLFRFLSFQDLPGCLREAGGDYGFWDNYAFISPAWQERSAAPACLSGVAGSFQTLPGGP